MCVWGRDGTSWFAQYRLLLWKNWTLRKRRAGASCCEILFPLGAVCILIMIRTLVKIDHVDTQIPVQDKVSVSADVPSFLASLACGIPSVSIDDVGNTGSGGTNMHRFPFENVGLAAGHSMPQGTDDPHLQAIATLIRTGFQQASTEVFQDEIPCCVVADPSSPLGYKPSCFLPLNRTRDFVYSPTSTAVRLFPSMDAIDDFISDNSDYGWHDTSPTLMLAAEINYEPPPSSAAAAADADGDSDAPRHWSYTIRANSSDIPFTGTILNTLATGYKKDAFFNYYNKHILTLQWYIEGYIVNLAQQAGARKAAAVRAAGGDETMAAAAAAAVTAASTLNSRPIPAAAHPSSASSSPSSSLAAAAVGDGSTGPPMPPVPSFLPSNWNELSFLAMPVPAHKQDNFKQYIGQVFGLFLVIAFMWPFSRMVRNMVEEKEKKLSEGMKMMGLRNSVFWMSWVTTYLISFFIVCILVILFCRANLFKYSDMGLLFLFFFSFCLSLISLACLVTTFFSRAKTAGTLSPFVLLAGYLPYFGVSDPTKSNSSKLSACLLSPVALSLGSTNILSFEGVFVGVQWNNSNQQVDNFSFGQSVALMFFDAVFYALIAWYLDKIWPREYGTPLPWYFIVTPSYWKGCCSCKDARARGRARKDALAEGLLDGESIDGAGGAAALVSPRSPNMRSMNVGPPSPEQGGGKKGAAARRALIKGGQINSGSSYGAASSLSSPLLSDADDPLSASASSMSSAEEEPDFGPDYEPVPPSMASKIGVKVRGLRKEFKRDGNEVVAVEGLDLNLYQGQCFVLLGHNGAGKTTTISMLTGMIPTSSGTAQLYGRDINHEMGEIRTFMGVCPQHDVLFDDLTVYEHLEFFGKLKGIPLGDLHRAVLAAIDEVQLKPKMTTKSASLSGGQRRRLSLAIALIGDSRVVFLDEPTSGVDPFSRRAIWDLLTKKKAGRVLVLTTHFMDEADQLGDRIGIMHHGRMKCCGTSLFLKSKFGVGYNMTLVKDPQHARVEDTTQLVRTHVPEASMLSSVGTELSYSLPFTASAVFPQLLGEIDARMAELGLVNYGLSVTTMEEVFIKVAEEQRVDSKEEAEELEKSLGKSGRSSSIVSASEAASAAHSKSAAAAAAAGDARDALAVDPTHVQASWSTHFRALLRKRYQIQRRDKKALCCQFLVPLILLSLGLGILRIPPNFNFPTVTLSPGDKAYNSPNRTPYNAGLAPQVWQNLHAPTDGTPEEFWQGGAGTGQYDLYNYSTTLLANRTQFKQSRYGAFFGTHFNETQWKADSWELTVMTNISAPHGLPTWTNVGQQALLRAATGDDSASIAGAIHPFAWTPRQRTAIQSINGVVASIVISLAFTFIPASFAVFVVSEREYKSKHLQLISGVSMSSYWAANFVWDFCAYLIPASISCGIIYAYGNPSLVDNFDCLCVSFLAYGVSIIPFTYLCSFLFASHSTAQNVMIMIYILGGIVMVNTAVALLFVPSTEHISKTYLRHFFRLIPSFCLGDAIFYISWLPMMDGASRWDLLVSGFDLIYMFGEGIVYFALTLAVEKLASIPSFVGLFRKDPDLLPRPDGQPEEPEDEDVRAERERLQHSALPPNETKFPDLTDAIEQLGPEAAMLSLGLGSADVESQRGEYDLIRLEGLRKVYPKKNAVKDVYFGIPAGQCFGFLGVNGAGKTTTLKMLTGDVTPSRGRAFIGGYDIAHYPAQVRRLMGYCPQFDALFELMTAREVLNFYGTIRGIPAAQMTRMVDFLIDRLSLTEYANRPCGTYSGGNKRKLSVAIALIGNPPVVFLDEPSTGMDPVSRRFMWDFISDTMTQRGVILTTHSMEECEALCSRIGMLVNGSLKCIGSSQHLKSRFGRGFQIDISTSKNDTQAAREFLLQHFPEAEKLEDYAGKMKYKIMHRRAPAGAAAAAASSSSSPASPSGDHSRWRLKDIFALIEAHKSRVGISEYSIGQTTLEQVFIQFAKRGDHEEFGGKLANEEEEEGEEQAEGGASGSGAPGAASNGPRGIHRVSSFDTEDPSCRIVTPSSFGYVPVDSSVRARSGINF